MMQIPATGRGAEVVLAELESYRGDDVTWRDGHAFSYVFHADKAAEEVAEKAFQKYMWENALDPTIFPSLLRFETEIVAMAARHLSGDDSVVGNFTSGGTESVLLAVKTTRDYARHRKPDLGRPQIVLPVTAHPCFHKAAQYFDLETVVVPVFPRTMHADVDAMRKAITSNTVLLVGSATTYGHGVVDPIREIGALALERDILFHVDGCIGAFLLPFLRKAGMSITDFDFAVPGVTSISMDLHKYAYCPKGASVILYRNAEIRRHQLFTFSAWPGYSMVNATVQSSKSGGPLAAAWAVLNYLGQDGYQQIADRLKASRDRLLEGIAGMEDLHVLGQPEMTLFAIGSKSVNLFRLCDEMKKRGWIMHPQLEFGDMEASVHLGLTPLNDEHVDGLLRAFGESVAAVNETAAPGKMAGLRSALECIDMERLDDKAVDGLLALAGLGGGGLPGDSMSEINEILNELSPEVTDRLLAVYYNSLSRYRETAK